MSNSSGNTFKLPMFSTDVSRSFNVVDVGVVADPINAAYDVHRYDCVISAADTAAIGADAMVRLDI